MIDSSKLAQMSDDELLSMQRINLPGNESREAAKAELEYRSVKRLAAFAASAEKSSRRLEFATWVILAATCTQLVLIVLPMMHERPANPPSSQVQQEPTSATPVPAVEGVKADVKDWTNAEVAVMCSNRRLLPWTSLDGKSKQVTLDCGMENLTDKALPFMNAKKKIDALFLLPDARVVRGKAYLGSNKNEIPAHGKIEGGLFPGSDDCTVKQSDSDCVRAELMESHELLLTDTASGTRYHVFIK